jgi:glucosylceramidase
MKKNLLIMQLFVTMLTCLGAKQIAYGQSSFKFDKATLNYVDLSDDSKVTAQPIKVKHVELSETNNEDNIIKINFDTIINAKLSGIGGAFNEQGGEAFMSLSKANREAVAKALFNPSKGSGFAFCRTAIGSSDFGLSEYSYSETADDYDMKHFSVDRDKKSVIPFISSAISQNNDLKLFASPWSPPGWMKISGKMDGGDVAPEANVLKSTPEIYKAYGLYFSKYLQAYGKHGITINRLIIQNETDMNPKYPGCDMLPTQMSELITSYIKPQFKNDKITTEIWAGSFRGKRSDAQNFMKLENANDVVGLGLQYCPPFVMKALNKDYPDIKIMHTEGRCENGDNSMLQARRRFGEIATWINSGSENYCYWNMVLNETSTSGWGWKQNSLIKIDRKTGDVQYNPDYAPVSLLSKFIRPGDQSLRVDIKKGAAIAVQNKNRLVVILQNNAKSSQKRYLKLEEKLYAVDLPAQSLSALVFIE